MSDHKDSYTGNRLVIFGGIGAAIVALCCVTPIFVWGLIAIGLVGLVAYADFVLLPLLAVALIVLFIGVKQVQKRRAAIDLHSSENTGSHEKI